jgi:hypothetical protein
VVHCQCYRRTPLESASLIACGGGRRDNSLLCIGTTGPPNTATRLHYSTTTAKRAHSRVSLLFSRIAAASLRHARLAPSLEPFSPTLLIRPLSAFILPGCSEHFPPSR